MLAEHSASAACTGRHIAQHSCPKGTCSEQASTLSDVFGVCCEMRGTGCSWPKHALACGQSAASGAYMSGCTDLLCVPGCFGVRCHLCWLHRSTLSASTRRTVTQDDQWDRVPRTDSSLCMEGLKTQTTCGVWLLGPSCDGLQAVHVSRARGCHAVHLSRCAPLAERANCVDG